MADKSRKKPLYFPTNCPDANDVVAGFGIKEIVISSIALITAFIVGIILYFNYHNMVYSLTLGAFIVAITVLMVRRNQYQESWIDQIKQIIAYHKAQKRFVYEYYNIYEGDNKNGES